MFERLKQIFNKDDFDPDSKGIKAFKYHSINGSFLLSNGIFFNHKDSRVRFVWPLICFFTAVIGSTLMILHIYHSIQTKNVPDISESIVYILIANIILVQMTAFAFKAGKVHIIIESLDRDFLEMDKAPRHYRKIFFDNQLLIWKVCVTWIFFILIIASGFCLKTFSQILYQQLIQNYYEGRKRAEMFKTWLPFVDSNGTPIYEILLVISYTAILMSVSTFGSYVSYLVQFIMHAVGQFDLVYAGFERIFDFSERESAMDDDDRCIILRRRVAHIAQRHQKIFEYCELVFDVLGPTLFYQMVLSSIAICVTGFQVVESIQNGGLHILFTLIFIGSLVQLYIPCFMGSILAQKATMVGMACYSCNWQSTDDAKYVAKDLQIFILRTSKPLNLNAMGHITITMETFSSIVSTAASYFTMLRQLNDENS